VTASAIIVGKWAISNGTVPSWSELYQGQLVDPLQQKLSVITVGPRGMNCPLYSGVVVLEGGGLSSRLVKRGRVEGTLVEDILLDNGCSHTNTREHLVPQDKIQSGYYVKIQCAHGDAVLYPTAKIQLEVGGKTIQLSPPTSQSLCFWGLMLLNCLSYLTTLDIQMRTV